MDLQNAILTARRVSCIYATGFLSPLAESAQSAGGSKLFAIQNTRGYSIRITIFVIYQKKAVYPLNPMTLYSVIHSELSHKLM